MVLPELKSPHNFFLFYTIDLYVPAFSSLAEVLPLKMY